MTFEGVVCTLGTLIGINVPSGYKTIAISEKFYKLLNSYKFKFANLRRLRLCINFICNFYFPQQKNPLKFSICFSLHLVSEIAFSTTIKGKTESYGN